MSIDFLRERWDREIKEAQKTIDKVNEQRVRIETWLVTARQKYPDLDFMWAGRSGGVMRFYAESARKDCTEAHIHAACSCCPDADLIADPYVTLDGIEIHGSERTYTAGGNAYDGGYYPNEGVLITFENEGYPQALMDKIRTFWDEHEPQREED